MLLKLARTACVIGLCVLTCAGPLAATAQAQSTTQGSQTKKKHAAKKPVQRTQPASGVNTNDRSIIPEKHDARNGY